MLGATDNHFGRGGHAVTPANHYQDYQDSSWGFLGRRPQGLSDYSGGEMVWTWEGLSKLWQGSFIILLMARQLMEVLGEIY